MSHHGDKLDGPAERHNPLSTDIEKDRPLTRPAKMAWFFWCFLPWDFWASVSGWHMYQSILLIKLMSVIRHGFEGAMVGCICDIIAVRNVYTKARDHFDPLVENESKAVVIDMIRLRTLIERFSRMDDLQNEANQEWFRQQLQALIPSREGIEAELERFWQQSLWHGSSLLACRD